MFMIIPRYCRYLSSITIIPKVTIIPLFGLARNVTTLPQTFCNTINYVNDIKEETAGDRFLSSGQKLLSIRSLCSLWIKLMKQKTPMQLINLRQLQEKDDIRVIEIWSHLLKKIPIQYLERKHMMYLSTKFQEKIPLYDSFEVALLVAKALEEEGISYALGGALACIFHGRPRTTGNVDINLWIKDEEIILIIKALEKHMGELYYDQYERPIDYLTLKNFVTEYGMFNCWWKGTNIKFFLPIVPFIQSLKDSRIRGIGNTYFSAWTLSVEAVVVFKLIFNRHKDRIDLEHLFMTCNNIDIKIVKHYICNIYGYPNERLTFIDYLLSKRKYCFDYLEK